MKTVAIVVSGGPAPGINTVIGASTIEAAKRGMRVLGFQDGFSSLFDPSPLALREITVPDISQLYNLGGSFLGTSRVNPFAGEPLERLRLGIQRYKIDGMIVIGGEGSAFLSRLLSQTFPGLRVAHIPKTIDNDIALPENSQSFGYETARHVGAKIVDTLLLDARTCERWYVAETMGRNSGHLALGILMASGATFALIPEEFQERLYSAHEIARHIVSGIRARQKLGKNYGVALAAEGLIERIDPESCPELRACPRDDLGRAIMSETELADVLLPIVQSELKDQSIDIPVKTKNIGYELRCAAPVSYDVEYAKCLGFGAIDSLSNFQGARMICRTSSELRSEPLDSFFEDGKSKVRLVDLDSDLYTVALHYMTRS